MKAKYEIDTDGQVVFTDGRHGAILLDDEQWYPFCYFDSGNLDIWDTEGGHFKASSAYKLAKLKFT